MRTSLCISIAILFGACRKDIKLDLPDYQQKVVVEASIETGSPATVFLSYSVPYFGEFDFGKPQTSFIKGALVTVSDGNLTDTLKELYPDFGYFYIGSKVVGKQGRSYTLRVTVGGKTFETRTSILQAPAGLDSLYFDQQSDSLGYIGQIFNEPAGSGDCYRWLAKRLGRDQLYAAPFNSVFDDKFIDGTKVDFIYNRGRQPDVFQPDTDDSERGYYKRGDTIVVKFCKIGRIEYDFWLTYYQNKSSNGNPFSAPANIKSMFNDYENVFGAFTGYSPSFDTIIIPYE